MTDHERWNELAAGYALDALEPDERAEFEAHLTHCATCRDGVDEHALVAAQLGALAGDDAHAAPPWSAIRAGVVGLDADVERGADVIDLRDRSRLAWLAAAAAVVAIGVGITTWQVNRGPSSEQPLASVAACRQAVNCRVVGLKPAAGVPVSGVPATVLVSGGKLALVSTSMPAPPSGHVWALWQVPRGGDPVLVSEFTKDVSPTQLKAPYVDTAAFAVSQETAGKAPTAPGEIVATGAVA